MEWINVEKELPYGEGNVLVYTSEREILLGYIHLGKMKISCGYCAEGNFVTHWMPLPEGPKD